VASISDLLSAASLFLATLGVLYSAWYADLNAALSMQVRKFKEDRRLDIELVESTLRNRSIPLALAGVAVTLILAPAFVSIIIEGGMTWVRFGARAIMHYDAVKTLFCAVYVVTFGLAVHLSRLTVLIRGTLSRLNGPSL
jgi:hypothetical protein